MFDHNELVKKNVIASLATASSALINFFGSKTEKIETQGLGDDLKSISAVLTHVLDSSLVKAFLGLIVSAASLKLFNADVGRALLDTLGKPKPMSFLEMGKYILDCVARLVHAAELLITGKMTLYEIFMKDDPLMEAISVCETLLATKDLTYSGLPVKGRIDRQKWVIEANGAIIVLQTAYLALAPGLEKRNELMMKTFKLQKALLELTTGMSARPTPMAICLFGDPSIGKSNILNLIYEVFSRAMGREFKPSHVYTKVCSSPYWDGYRTGEHPITFISEVATDNQLIATKQKDEVLSLVTSLIDSNVLPLDMSDTKEKGTVFFQSQLLCVDTNNVDMNIPFTKMNPAAYFRRFLYIEPRVRPEYRKAGSTAIDPDKCNDGKHWLDRYTFAVFLREPKSTTKYTEFHFMNHHEDDNVYRFCEVMTAYIQRFTAAQEASMNRKHDHKSYDEVINGKSDVQSVSSSKKPSAPSVDTDATYKPNAPSIATSDYFRAHSVVTTVNASIPSTVDNGLQFDNLSTPSISVQTKHVPSVPVSTQPYNSSDSDYRDPGPVLFGKIEYESKSLEARLTPLVQVKAPKISLEEIERNQKLMQSKARIVQLQMSGHDECTHGVRKSECPGEIYRLEKTRPLGQRLPRVNITAEEKRIDAELAKLDSEKAKRAPKDPKKDPVGIWEHCEMYAFRARAYQQKCIEIITKKWGEIPQGVQDNVDIATHTSKELCNLAYYQIVQYAIGHILANSQNDHPQWDFSFERCVVAVFCAVMAFCTGFNPFVACFFPLIFLGWQNLRVKLFNEELAKIRNKASAEIVSRSAGLKVYLGYEALKKRIPRFESYYQGLKWASVGVGLLLAARSFHYVATEVMVSKKKKIAEKAATFVEPISATLTPVVEEEKVAERVISTHVSAFVEESEVSDRIVKYEHEVGAGKSFVRVKNYFINQFNSRELPEVVHTKSLESLLQLANQNVRRVKIFQSDGVGYVQYCLMMDTNELFINLHALLSFPLRIYVSMVGSYDDKDEITRGNYITENDVVRMKNDYALVSVSAVKAANIYKFFVDQPTMTLPVKAMIGKSEVTATLLSQLEFRDDFGKTIPIEQAFGYKWKDGEKGMCGWPLATECANGFAIMGIHGGGRPQLEEGFAPFVSKSELVSARNQLIRQTKFVPINTAARNVPETEDPIHASAFRYQRMQGLHYIGKTKGAVLAKSESKLKPTFLVNSGDIYDFEEIVNDHPSTIYLPPMMKGTMRDGKYFNPVNYGLNKMTQEKGFVDKSIVHTAFTRFENHIIDTLKSHGIVELAPLDMETAINGVSYDAYVRRVDASKAAGFGKKGSKSKYIPIVAEIDGVPVRELTSDVKSEIIKMLEEYEEHRCAGVVYTAALKDEPREKSRALSGNTRLFYVSPLASLIVARMFLAPFYSLMVEHPNAFFTAIGIDMHRQGHTVWSKLKSHSVLWMELDYAKYDLAMPFEIKWGTATMICNILRRLGYNDKALVFVKGILSDELFPMVELLKDLFVLPGIQCSGAYATAEKNSLDGVLLFMVFWYSTEGLKDKDFVDYVKIIVYGDDVLAAVHPDVAHLMNNRIYRDFCARVYKMEVTSASKSGEMEEFIEPEDASFLKRKIKFHPVLNRDVATLSMDSIHKMLRWYLPSNSATPQDQHLSMFNSALTELFLHVDEETYRRVRNFFVDKFTAHFKVERTAVAKAIFSYDWMLNSLSIVETQSKKISDAPVGGMTYLRDHVSHYEYELKNAEEELLHVMSPFPGLTRAEVIASPHYATNHAVQLEANHYFSLVAKVESCKLSLEAFKRSVRKKGIQTHAKRISDPLDQIHQLKIALVPVTRLVADGTLKEMTMEHLKKTNSYLESVRMRLGDEVPEWKFDNVADFDAITTIVEWASGEICITVLDWRAWCVYCKAEVNPETNKIAIDILDRLMRLSNTLMDLCDVIEFTTPIEDVHAVIETQSKPIAQQEDGVITIEEKHETIVDASGAEPTIEQAVESSDYSILSSTQLHLDNFFERPFQLTTLSLTLGSDTNSAFDIWHEYFLNPTVRSKLRNIGFMRGDLNVKLQLSGMPFHTGKVQVAYTPQSDDNAVGSFYATNFSTYRRNALKWLSQRNAVYMDIKSNDPLTLKLGYVNYQPLMRVFNQSASAMATGDGIDDTTYLGKLWINTLNPPTSSVAGSSPPFIEVYVWFTNYTFGCTTGSVMAIQTESRRMDERKTGPVERTATQLARIADASAPMIGPLALASSMALRGIAQGASLMGWSYPVTNEFPHRMKNEPFQNGAQLIGMNTGKRLTLDPAQETSIDLSVCGTSKDELSIAWIGSQESLLDTFTWHHDHAPMTVEWSCAVHPGIFVPIVGMTNTVVQPTAMAFASRPFAYWRAKSIDFKIMVETNAFVRGKFAMCFEPNIAQYALITSNVQLNKEWTYIVDLQETQEITFCIEWAQSTPWLSNASDTVLKDGVGTIVDPSAWNRIANGFIFFVPITEVQSNDGSDLNVNVFVKATDLDVNFPTTDYLPTSRIMTQSRRIEDVDHSCVVLNPSGFQIRGVCQHYFGERPISFRALMKRFVSIQSLTHALAATDTKAVATLPIIPPISPGFNVAPSGLTSILSYLCYAYLGKRGSLRYRVRLRGVTTSTMDTTVVSHYSPATSTVATSLASFASSAQMRLEGSVEYIPATNGGIEFSVPFYTPNLYIPAGNDDPLSLGTSNFNTFTERNYFVSFEFNAPGSTPTVTFLQEFATDEDFNMTYFYAAPPYSFPT